MSERGNELRAQLLDPMSRRPWLDAEGKSKLTLCNSAGECQTVDAPDGIVARLTREQWLAAGAAITARFREQTPLTCWLREYVEVLNMQGRGLTRMVLEHEPMTDPGDPVDMEGPPLDPDHVPVFKVIGLPLPITHCDLSWKEDKDFTNHFLPMCEAAGRRVGEAVERMLLDGWDGLGADPKASDQGYLDKLRLLGLANCGKPVRFGGSIGVQDALKLLSKRGFWGPFVIATDADDGVQGVRRAAKPDGVCDVVSTSALAKGEEVILQATSGVVRIVVGLEPTLMQWDDGWKVACVIVPQVRCDFRGNVGVAVKRNG